jgi:hypothetical protein
VRACIHLVVTAALVVDVEGQGVVEHVKVPNNQCDTSKPNANDGVHPLWRAAGAVVGPTLRRAPKQKICHY